MGFEHRRSLRQPMFGPKATQPISAGLPDSMEMVDLAFALGHIELKTGSKGATNTPAPPSPATGSARTGTALPATCRELGNHGTAVARIEKHVHRGLGVRRHVSDTRAGNSVRHTRRAVAAGRHKRRAGYN